jgi:hypothetical protein
LKLNAALTYGTWEGLAAELSDGKPDLPAVAVAAATVPDNFAHNTFLPYHPGASRYSANRVMTGAIKDD